MSACPPEVSVLLPTVQPWPAVAAALDAVLSQATARCYEVLLLDGHGAALAAPPSHPAVRWLRLPGSDSFALRAAGVAAARGRIVAVTEDHCLAPAAWIDAIVAAHEADGATALIGPVVNHPESAQRAIDRANFLLTFAAQTPATLGVALRRRLPVPTNLSFKRAALPPAGLAPGELEYAWLAGLCDARALGTASSVVLQHRQSWGRAAPAVHFASGRSYGASVRQWWWIERVLWWCKLPLLPLKLARLVTPDLLRGGGARRSLADALCLALLILANVCGQTVGALRGPGTSRRRL